MKSSLSGSAKLFFKAVGRNKNKVGAIRLRQAAFKGAKNRK
jgi:hypothetical protein